MEKGENAGYQHFILFPQCSQKASFPGLCGKELSNFGKSSANAFHLDKFKILSFGEELKLYSMVFKAIFNSISGISWQPVYLSMLS